MLRIAAALALMITSVIVVSVGKHPVTRESTWSPPGATHWHGSAPDQSAKLYQISRGETTWMEAVRDEDYRAPVKR
jgi:hypothetical protein